MAELYFDASQVPEQSFDPLPAGDYFIWVTESDIEKRLAEVESWIDRRESFESEQREYGPE